MKRNLIVRQEYNKECGSACLLSIIRYYGGNVSMNSLIELTKTDKNGTNFYNMMEASKSIGLNSKCYKITEISNLYEIDRPFITQVISNNFTHFIVIYKIKENKVTIMDPGQGKVVVNINVFLDNFTGFIMLFEPYKRLPIIKDRNFLKEVIVEALIDNRKIIFNILLLSIIFTIMTCIYSFYLNIVISIISNNLYANLLIISITFAIIEVIKHLANYSRSELLYYLSQKLDLTMILNTFNKIILLPYNYYKNKTTGEVVSRINDIIFIRNLISKLIVTIFLDSIIIIISSLILIKISSKMFIFLLIIISVYLVIFIIFRPTIIKLTNINQENNSKLNSFLVENITGFETIKGLNVESIVRNKFSRLYCKSLENELLYNKVGNVESLLKNLANSIGTVIVLYLGIIELKNNDLTLGMLITFYTLMACFLDNINNIIDLNQEYYYAKNALKRINSLFQVDNINLNSNNNINLNGDIAIKNLTFSYNNHNVILNDFSLNIKNNEKVLILGSSGSGKSTLLKIIYKYFVIPRNKVFINNNDLNDYELGDIRKNISYISQNEILYTDTIKNNILLERNINYNKFIDICKITYIEDIVKDKFLGYDTMLEENGSNLSGGQRQKIILARTLLRDNNIMLIDEGFSEIDINTERRMLKNIFNYYRNTTFIIVSHRLDNLDLYDKVIKVDNGKIIDTIERSCNG